MKNTTDIIFFKQIQFFQFVKNPLNVNLHNIAADTLRLQYILITNSQRNDHQKEIHVRNLYSHSNDPEELDTDFSEIRRQTTNGAIFD